MNYKCKCCEKPICKYLKDFKASGGLDVSMGEKEIMIHRECAKEIMGELLDSVGL